MKIRTASLALVAVLAAGIAGCAKENTTANSGTAPVTVAATNTKCPYTGNPVNKSVTSTYDSKSVAFCCNGCKGKFDGASASDKTAMIAKAK